MGQADIPGAGVWYIKSFSEDTSRTVKPELYAVLPPFFLYHLNFLTRHCFQKNGNGSFTERRTRKAFLLVRYVFLSFFLCALFFGGAFGFLFVIMGMGFVGDCSDLFLTWGWGMQHRGFCPFYFVGRVYVMNMSDTMTVRCLYVAVVYVMSVLELAGGGSCWMWWVGCTCQGQWRGIDGAPPCASSKGHASPDKDFRHPLLVPARSSPPSQLDTDPTAYRATYITRPSNTKT